MCKIYGNTVNNRGLWSNYTFPLCISVRLISVFTCTSTHSMHQIIFTPRSGVTNTTASIYEYLHLATWSIGKMMHFPPNRQVGRRCRTGLPAITPHQPDWLTQPTLLIESNNRSEQARQSSPPPPLGL